MKHNFIQMYELVYEAMVDSGVAIQFDTEVILDHNGKITSNEDEALGEN